MRFVLYGRASYLFERTESLGLLPQPLKRNGWMEVDFRPSYE